MAGKGRKTASGIKKRIKELLLVGVFEDNKVVHDM